MEIDIFLEKRQISAKNGEIHGQKAINILKYKTKEAKIVNQIFFQNCALCSMLHRHHKPWLKKSAWDVYPKQSFTFGKDVADEMASILAFCTLIRIAVTFYVILIL